MLDITNYIEPFVDVTIDTFKEFVGIDVKPTQPYFVDTEKGHEWDISAVIGLSGIVKGAIIISMKTDLAVRITDILDGPGHVELDADVVDAIGEINNIIAGNIKPRIPDGDKIVISIPTVIKGNEHSIAWPGKMTRILCIPHQAFDKDIFHLMVAIELDFKAR